MKQQSYHKRFVGTHKLAPDTLMMSYGYDPKLSEGAVKTPLFMSSTFAFRTAEEGAHFFDVTSGRVKLNAEETSGLVYSRNFEGQRHVFVPHAWVHAWTGSAWESFDAALGYFDSTHLAFAVSLDGNPAELFAGLNLSHELKLVSAARVLPRKPAN